MRVLLLNHEYPPLGGGSAVATKHLAEALVRLGHTVRVLTPGTVDRRGEQHGVGVQQFRVALRPGRLAGWRTWLSFLRRGPEAAKRAIADFRPDVVHSQFLFPSGWVVARTSTTVPHVASTVGAEIHDPSRRFAADRNRVMRRCIQRVVRHARVVTTSARDLTVRLRALFPEAADVAEVPWPVPALVPDQRSRTDLGLPEDRLVVATLCRLVRRKRIDVLLDAVRHLGPDRAFLVVMGSGPLADPLRQSAEALGIAASVRFTGHVGEADKAAYLDSADVFCLPSDHEGFGLVYVEAMSVGTPVIATDVGGQTDVIRDGIDGFLVPRGDPRAVADRIAALGTDPELLARMKRAVPERAREFEPDIVAARFIGLYERAARSRSRAG